MDTQQPGIALQNNWTEDGVKAKAEEKNAEIVNITESDIGRSNPYRVDQSCGVACVEIDADNEASVESSDGDGTRDNKVSAHKQPMSDSHNSIITHMDCVIERARRAINCDEDRARVVDDLVSNLYL